jgi:hypothetical protein
LVSNGRREGGKRGRGVRREERGERGEGRGKRGEGRGERRGEGEGVTSKFRFFFLVRRMGLS